MAYIPKLFCPSIAITLPHVMFPHLKRDLITMKATAEPTKPIK